MSRNRHHNPITADPNAPRISVELGPITGMSEATELADPIPARELADVNLQLADSAAESVDDGPPTERMQPIPDIVTAYARLIGEYESLLLWYSKKNFIEGFTIGCRRNLADAKNTLAQFTNN